MLRLAFPAGRKTKTRQQAVLAGHGLHGPDVRDLFRKAWTVATLLRPRASRQSHRIIADAPALRQCVRCSKIECSTS
jgi:hypothetical protein